ncbi:MAG: LemA family protein [Phycisphaerae bacterium]|nr:LemA family protein [Phycisphaerae bacterium]
MRIAFYALIGVALLLVFGAIGIYNGLVRLRHRVRNAFAQIDVQLKRRYDLIPNLVESVRAYLKHERETLEAVIAARNEALKAAQAAAAAPSDAGAIRSLIGAEQALAGPLGRLLAVAESYPNLKADQTIGNLMEELASTENRVAFARQAYNDAVMEYNATRESFPTVIVAGLTGFQPAELFEIEAAQERSVPRVAL